MLRQPQYRPDSIYRYRPLVYTSPVVLVCFSRLFLVEISGRKVLDDADVARVYGIDLVLVLFSDLVLLRLSHLLALVQGNTDLLEGAPQGQVK